MMILVLVVCSYVGSLDLNAGGRWWRQIILLVGSAFQCLWAPSPARLVCDNSHGVVDGGVVYWWRVRPPEFLLLVARTGFNFQG